MPPTIFLYVREGLRVSGMLFAVSYMALVLNCQADMSSVRRDFTLTQAAGQARDPERVPTALSLT